MERLTERINGHAHGAEGVSANRLTGNYCRGKFEATACVEKLAEYEDLEEQGKLLKLPCAVGDTVYSIKSRYTKCSAHNEEFDKYKCLCCRSECDSKKKYFVREQKVSMVWIVLHKELIGKDFFLTIEEAEAALKEL